MNTSMIVYRLFDVADAINLDQVQALWLGKNMAASRLRLDRISTKSITFKDPPVLVELGSHEMEIGGKAYFVEVKARIQELGVICLIFHFFFDEDISYAEYQRMLMATNDLPEDKIKVFLNAVLETIHPACTKERVSEFEEDYVVCYFHEPIPPDWDLAPLLLKDTHPVNEQTRKDALSNCFSYADDITYLTWDVAVVYDSTGSMDIPDLLEFANAQFLELRYYDNFLDLEIDKTYDAITQVSPEEKRSERIARFRNIRNRLLETMADVSTLTGNITNALQVTEDIFYARVYAKYLELLKANVWQENIEIKMRVMQRYHNLLNEDVATHRLEHIGRTVITLLWVLISLMVIFGFILFQILQK